MDPEDYKKLPISQYEEDNILRELNKLLLGFQQKQLRNNEPIDIPRASTQRRLSPIGESVSSTPPELNNKTVIITQPSSSTNESNPPIKSDVNLLKPPIIPNRQPTPITENTASSRRGRFIVLGSSGECLPVKRNSVTKADNGSNYSSCNSSEEEFHSARQSLDEGEYCSNLDYYILYYNGYALFPLNFL